MTRPSGGETESRNNGCLDSVVASVWGDMRSSEGAGATEGPSLRDGGVHSGLPHPGGQWRTELSLSHFKRRA